MEDCMKQVFILLGIGFICIHLTYAGSPGGKTDAVAPVESVSLVVTPEIAPDGATNQSMPQTPRPAGPIARSDRSLIEATANVTLASHLQAIPTEYRAEIEIDFEFEPASAIPAAALAEIRDFWNQGDFDWALNQLTELEARTALDAVILATGWKNPRPTAPAWGTDIQIYPGTSARAAFLDMDPVSGNLFALIKFEKTCTFAYSSDNGQSWNETYSWSSTGRFIDADLTVCQNYVYVGYASAAEAGSAKMRRFATSNGQRDAAYGIKSIFNMDAIVELELASNFDAYNNRVYYFAILENNSLLWYWSDQNGSAWYAVNTGISNAKTGLSAGTDPGYKSGVTDYHTWFSYHQTNDLLAVARIKDSGGTAIIERFTLGNCFDVTSIAAYNSRILVAYEFQYTSGEGIRYQISYDGDGTAWYFGDVAVPASTGQHFESPSVTGRRNGGMALIYQEEGGAFDPCWFRHREYGTTPGTANWTAAEQFNERDVVTGYPMQVEWLPPNSGSSQSHGVVWCGGSDVRGYFDRIDGSILPMTLRIYNPNDGEVWFVGSNYAINWEASSNTGHVRVEISTNDGSSWWAIGTVVNDGQTHYTPVIENVSGQCKMRVVYADDESIKDETDDNFTIVEASYIKQYTANKLPASIAVPVIDGNFTDAAWSLAGAETPLAVGGSSGDFLIPWSNLTNNNVRYRAIWSLETNMLYLAVAVTDNRAGANDHDFAELGQDDTIEFYVDGDQSKLFYQDNASRAQNWRIRRDNKKHLNYIAGEYTGSAITSAIQYGSNGDFNLEVAMKIFEEYPGRTKNLTIGDVIGWDIWYDDSDNNVVQRGKYVREYQVGWGYMGHAWHNEAAFQELYFGPENAACNINVTAPNGGETAGCELDIRWTSTLTSGTVKIEYWCNGGWQPVTVGTPDDGFYRWQIPAGTDCPATKIRISDRDVASCFDTSDNNFSILCPSGVCNPPYVKALDAGGLPGNTVTIPIQVLGNPSPIDAIGLKFAFCHPKLTLVAVQRGTLTQNFTYFQGTQTTNGLITIGGFHSTAIPANSDGTIANIVLSVNQCLEGETCRLEIRDLVDDLAGLNACPGIFSCTQSCVRGDVNMDKALTPGDALCAFTIYLNGGTAPAGDCNNACALYAADANCDATVTPGDALVIFQGYLTGKTLPLSCPSLAKSVASPSFNISIENCLEPSTEQLIFPVRVANPKGLQAFGFDLGFPADALTFVGIQRDQLTEKWHTLDARRQTDGVVSVGGFDASGIQTGQSGVLLNLVFKCNPATTAAGEIWLFNFVDDFKNAETSSFELSQLNPSPLAGDQPVPARYGLNQNFPNPFNLATEIEYQLPEAGHATITIFNSLGQRIRTLISAHHEAGTYIVRWDGRDRQGHDIPSGIYFYQLATRDYSEIKKMSVIR
jgi:hypothetical protein